MTVKRLICLVKRHRFACVRTIVLNPNGTADIEHMHYCLRCSQERNLPTEPLDSELMGLLKGAVGEWGPVKNFEPPKTYIH